MAARTWIFALGGASVWRACQGAKVAQLIQSARDTGDRLADKGSLDFVPDFHYNGTVVSLSRALDQEIVGFGGAFTEAAALVFHALPEAQQQRVIEMYYGPSGIGYTMGRIHINSCDFSPANYNFDNVAGDFALKHFDSQVTHDTETMIPLVKQAQASLDSQGKELKMLATPWSPPPWMKTNGKMDGSGRPGLNSTCKWVWAKYFSKWIDAYKAHGIPIWAVTPQNEPENIARWEACVYSPDQEMEFIADALGPILRADHPEVKLLVFDHNKDHVKKWADALFANPQAEQYAHGVAFHWYTGDQFNHVAEIHKEHPKALLFASEATYERWRWTPGTVFVLGDWATGMGYAHDILNDLNAGASGWMDWNLLVDEHGGPNHVDNVCDAAMIGNGTELYIHPQYYGIGHFSKYFPPHSKRVVTYLEGTQSYAGPTRDYGTCDERDGLEAVAAMRPDGLLAVVVLNCGQDEVQFKLQDGEEALMASIPGFALQTYLISGSSGSSGLDSLLFA